MIDPRALGVTGRTVRCTNCSHTWAQLPPEDAPRRVDLPPADTMAPGPPPKALAPPTPSAEAAAAQKPRRIGSPVLVGLLVVVVLAFLWYERDAVMTRFPELARIYAALGVTAGDARDDLEFRKVGSSREDANGHSTLVIEGEVINISKLAHQVPPLRITLQDAGKHSLKSWTVVATGDRLLPGASVPFRATVTDPSDATVGAVVTFDWGND
jgi:Protein of unknown function (DUF3426)